MFARDHNSPGTAANASCLIVPDWQPRCIKLSEWPEIDQWLWKQGFFEGSPSEPGGHGARLRPDSIKKVMKGYGAWLSFLQASGWLDERQSPAERVTPQRLAAYFKAMRTLGRSKYSILGRFIELRIAMKILAPEHDTSWILKPNGVTIREMLRPQSRAVVVPDSKVLFDWGIGLMQTAKLDAPRRAGLIQYRDGLLIAMLAARARRLRSMALLRIGHEFTRVNNGYRVELQPEQVKTAKYDAFSLPKGLTPYIRQYLNAIRPALLRRESHEEFWIGRDGEPLQAKGIQNMICNRSKAHFGVTFGPHRFRHAIATTAPLRDPSQPGLAAALLGISKEVVQLHYNRAKQVSAVQQFQSLIERRDTSSAIQHD